MNTLVKMDVSLSSIEVMNKLANVNFAKHLNFLIHFKAPEFPKEFIDIYVLNCVQKCEKLTDKFVKNRLVRLVCVFIQSLIRNKIIISPEIMVEISTFCVEFNKIKEALALYKLIKSSD